MWLGFLFYLLSAYADICDEIWISGGFLLDEKGKFVYHVVYSETFV